MIYLQIDGTPYTPAGGGTLVPLTADNILVSVDAIDLTADLEFYFVGTYDYLIDTIVREDVNDFTIQFKNELTLETFFLDVLFFVYQEERLKLYFNYTFKEGDSFEVRIFDNDNKIIRREKAYASSQASTENYKIIENSQSNDEIIIMD